MTTSDEQPSTSSGRPTLPEGYVPPNLSSASVLNATPEQIHATSARRPKPLASLTASAKRITETTNIRTYLPKGSKDNWQDDAWDMLDLVGEQRFLANTLAGRMSQARLFVGHVADNSTDDPIPTEDSSLQDLLDEIGGGEVGLGQILQRLGVNLFIPGEGWLAGVPSALIPAEHRSSEPRPDYDPDAEDIDLTDLEWRVFSTSEISADASGSITLKYGPGKEDEATVLPRQVYLIRVWRGHPRYAWQADSPTRSVLPVLREIVGLTMHVSAQVDSRLAGAGLLLVPETAAAAVRRASGLEPDDDSDPFVEALIEGMITPINDRSSASAYVPLTVTVPDESIDKFRHITFDKPLDGLAAELRDEAIRRLALGQDAPPELLLGVAGMNHWGAWLVREDVVTTHIEPPLALICDALTSQYLWPVLRAQHPEWDEETVEQHVIWYDVSHMIVRPNRSDDAFKAHDAGVISDQALREAAGFAETDAPAIETEPGSEINDPAVAAALDLVRGAPSLLQNPGLLSVVEQIRSVLEGTTPDPAIVAPAPAPATDDAPAPDTPATTDDTPSDGMPATDGDPAEPTPITGSGNGDGSGNGSVTISRERGGFIGYLPPLEEARR